MDHNVLRLNNFSCGKISTFVIKFSALDSPALQGSQEGIQPMGSGVGSFLTVAYIRNCTELKAVVFWSVRSQLHESGFRVQEEGLPAAQRVVLSDVPGQAVFVLLQYLYTAQCCVPAALQPHMLELASRWAPHSDPLAFICGVLLKSIHAEEQVIVSVPQRCWRELWMGESLGYTPQDFNSMF